MIPLLHILYATEPNDYAKDSVHIGQQSSNLWNLHIHILFLNVPYISGTHFIVEYHHLSLKPIYQKKLKGAIYERWLAIL